MRILGLGGRAERAAPAVTDESAAAIHAAALAGQGDDSLPPGKLTTTPAAPPASYPEGYTEALQTALEIASVDLVNIEVGAAMLVDQFPGMFESVESAATSIRAAAR